jgi:hypothetical protein
MNKFELFKDAAYFSPEASAYDINLNSPYDHLKVDPSHIYDGLDVMNMSNDQLT